MKCIIMKCDQFLGFLARLTGGGRWAACSPLVVIVVVLRVVVLARVNTRLHGELLQIGEAERKNGITQHFLQRDSRAVTSVGGVSVAWLQPCEIGGAGVALPQVSEEMASAAAVAAKDCYREEKMKRWEETGGPGETQRRGRVRFTVRKRRFFFFFFDMPMFYNRGGGEGQENKGKIKECKGKSEIATAAKTRLMTDDKKMLSSHRVPDGATLFIPQFFILLLPGGKNENKSHQKAYLLFDSSAGE